MTEKTYWQIYGIRRPFRGFQLLDEKRYCKLCKEERQLCMVGMMRDFKYNWKRCSVCLVKLPLPIKIQAFLKRFEKKKLAAGQQILAS